MSRVPPFALALTLLCAAQAAPMTAGAQPAVAPDAAVSTAPPPPAPPPPAPPVAAPAPVLMTPIAAPDAFTTPARPTGLNGTLWLGSSLQVVRAVLPLLAEKPLSPAAAALARRVLGTGAIGPQGAGNDPVLLGGRAAALAAQGDPKGAGNVLAHSAGLDRSPELARAAAESALLSGDDGRACEIESNLTAGREDIYWVRLRTYCQAIGGKAAEAQLTFDLAQSQAADPIFTRLMAAKLAGAGNPGAPSLRNGLDYALSRNLGLDLSQAKPSPAVAAALAGGDPAEPTFEAIPPELAGLAQAIMGPEPLPPVALERLLDAADSRDPKARARFSAAALLALPFGADLGPTLRARVAALPTPEGKAPAGRNLALEAASIGPIPGETAMLALWICAEAGPAGLTVGDRARIVLALRRVGLMADARNFALEGLAALK